MAQNISVPDIGDFKNVEVKMQNHILKPSCVFAIALSIACSESKDVDSAEPNDSADIEDTGSEDSGEDTGPTTGVEDADGDGFS